MATWAKVKFFYKTMLGSTGSTLTATSTEADNDYDADYILNWLETNMWKAEDSGIADPQYITYDEGANLGSELMGNIGFETAGGGGADVFADWTEDASDGSIDDETSLVNSGSHACKLTQGTSVATKINQLITVTAGDIIHFSFYTRGDGAYDGRYQIYDITNGVPIVSVTSTGIVGTTYAQITKRFTVPALCTTIRIQFYPAATDTAIAYFDDCTFRVDTATAEADYIAVLGHNLNTAGVTATLQYSMDNFDTDTNDAFTGIAVSADTVFSKEFTSPGAHRYWRMKLAGHGSIAPYMTLAVWGEATELDYMSSSIDPYADDIKATVNRTQGGHVSGVHVKHTMRNFNLTFDTTDQTVRDRIRTWRDNHGLKNFFLAWEVNNNPSDVWLMRPSGSTLATPYSDFNTSYYNASIQLEGRKE